MDNARESLATGREPRVLWKNHADFIAILLQMVLQIAGKRKRDRTSRRGCTMSWSAGPLALCGLLPRRRPTSYLHMLNHLAR